MVEVLKRGQVEAARAYETTCYKCKSDLRFKRSEARYHSDQRDGDMVEVTCPVCSTSVYVDADTYRAVSP